MALTDTPWCILADKLYLTSGQFSAVIKTSRSVISSSAPEGVCWDGYNTPWCGILTSKLYLQSGQFTAVVKTSVNISSFETAPSGISWDITNTPICGDTDNKLYLTSGQFSTFLKTSKSVGDVDSLPAGISFDRTNTPWCGANDRKLYLQSGQFDTVLKTSQYVHDAEVLSVILGISWDGTNTLWGHYAHSKLMLTSGQFSAVIKTSQSVGSAVSGIDTNNIFGRLSLYRNVSKSENIGIKRYQVLRKGIWKRDGIIDTTKFSDLVYDEALRVVELYVYNFIGVGDDDKDLHLVFGVFLSIIENLNTRDEVKKFTNNFRKFSETIGIEDLIFIITYEQLVANIIFVLPEYHPIDMFRKVGGYHTSLEISDSVDAFFQPGIIYGSEFSESSTVQYRKGFLKNTTGLTFKNVKIYGFNTKSNSIVKIALERDIDGNVVLNGSETIKDYKTTPGLLSAYSFTEVGSESGLTVGNGGTLENLDAQGIWFRQLITKGESDDASDLFQIGVKFDM